MVIKKSKATNPSWGGRFEDSVNKLAVSYTSSLDQDKRMYQEDIVGSMKYAQALKALSYTHQTLPTTPYV